MLFNSFVFILFLIVVVPLFFLIPKRLKTSFILLVSYVFYGYWDWRFLSLLLISTVVDFLIGLQIYKSDSRKVKKWLLITSMTINLAILVSFKYFNFFIDSFENISRHFGGELDFFHLNIILPVGISFYTFQTMSYTIDIYKNQLKPTKSFIDFALFVSFFPQLVAGPIEKAKHLLPQIQRLNMPTKMQIQQGLVLIIIGLFRKVMIGDACGRIVDNIFAHPEYYKSIELLSGLVLFSIQIYADFSGYSLIAVGTAKLLGIELTRNFEQPYLSANITEFWRRWHISLSSWLKEYLYVSLGGNRKGKARTYINLLITMLLGGLWHGANWTFVVWGGLHGLYLSIHKWMLNDEKVTTRFNYQGGPSILRYLINATFTYILVLFAWLFFRAESFSQAWYLLENILTWEASNYTLRFITITLTFFITSLLLDVFEYSTQSSFYILRIRSNPMRLAILSGMVFITCMYMYTNEPLPFVYFQF